MTLSARQDLVRLAREFDALIVCDDVYDCLYWSASNTKSSESNEKLHEAVVPRLVDVDATLDGGEDRKGADGFGNVLSNGSFSKIVGPGVRTGWAESMSPKLQVITRDVHTQ
jgi:DNA-binding transcriptional MocR family regulator